MARAPISTTRSSSILPQIEQNIHRERPPVLDGNPVEPGYVSRGFFDHLHDIGTRKTRVWIIVSRMAFTLHINEEFPETPYSPRESVQHILPGTPILGRPMFQSPVSLTPRPLASTGGRYPDHHIGAAASQCVEQRIVRAADSTAQFRLTRSPYPVVEFPGRQVQGDSYQVTRIYHICLRTPLPSPISPRTTCWAG